MITFVPWDFVRFSFSLFIIEGRRFVSEDRNEGDLYDTIRLGMNYLLKISVL